MKCRGEKKVFVNITHENFAAKKFEVDSLLKQFKLENLEFLIGYSDIVVSVLTLKMVSLTCQRFLGRNFFSMCFFRPLYTYKTIKEANSFWFFCVISIDNYRFRKLN